MAGLLAWAADVVTGNGTAEQLPQNEQERSPLPLTLRFSADQQEEVRKLEAHAAALQHTIQHLRLRIPPADISRSLPQLHSDSLAAHSALTSELNAHQATQIEAQNREAALQAENAAYAKAIKSVQKQVDEKSRERFSLDERLQAMGNEESQLRIELDRLQSSLAAQKQARPPVCEGKAKSDMPILLSSDKILKEGEDLQRTRLELKLWEAKVLSLEQEWALLLQTSSRWPSAAQREKELEHRLRSLSEQLVTKQVQVDALTKERNLLELQLVQANNVRRQSLVSNADDNASRTKTKRLVLPISSAAGVSLTTEDSNQWASLATGQTVKRVFSQITEVFWLLWGGLSTKASRRQIGTELRASSAIRVLMVVYVLSLHIIAFAVISFAN